MPSVCVTEPGLKSAISIHDGWIVLIDEEYN